MAEPSSASASKPVDMDHLARYTGGDVAVQAEVFALFREQAVLWMRLLEPDATDDAWSSAAHTMKGAARGIGAFALGDACEAAEGLMGPEARVRRSVAAQDVRTALNAVLEFIGRQDHRASVSALRSASQTSNS